MICMPLFMAIDVARGQRVWQLQLRRQYVWFTKDALYFATPTD